MLRKLRRGSKDSPEDVLMRLRSRENSLAIPSAELISEETINNAARLTFFDLPAEIRNSIYDFAISETTLSLPCNILTTSKKPKLLLKRRKSLAPPTSINGLLLASRQCRHEYLSVLLSSVYVVVEVKDFDFENLIRVSSGLDDFESKALQSNRHLTLLLNTRNCTTKDLASLRRWLEYRRDEHPEKRLPWKYEFPLDKLLPSKTMGRVRLLRELEYYADTIEMLDLDTEGKQTMELKAIVEAFESKALWLDDDLGWLGQRSKSFSRQVRGLAGGGIY